jgi:hypothetical protein
MTTHAPGQLTPASKPRTGKHPVRRAHTRAHDPRLAAAELRSAFSGQELALLLVFTTSAHDLARLGPALRDEFAPVPVVGCTTAGEIGPDGYLDGSMTAVGLASTHFTVASAWLPDLDAFDEASARELSAGLLARVGGTHEECFSLLLVDGLSIREERVARQCQRALGDIPLVGGSAGDDQEFEATHVLHDGRFDRGAAWLVVRTVLPFTIFRSSHFVGQGEPLVVTDADADRRVVRAINGLPAAHEYARVLGVELDALTRRQLAAAPFVVKVGGNDYVRSVQKVHDDGSLTLYCAIERGVVLRVARGAGLVDTRRSLFEEIRSSVGAPLVTLAFDCIQCKVEAEDHSVKEEVQALFLAHNVTGFASYGEQFVGSHVNQTFTGIAIGGPRP